MGALGEVGVAGAGDVGAAEVGAVEVGAAEVAGAGDSGLPLVRALWRALRREEVIAIARDSSQPTSWTSTN